MKTFHEVLTEHGYTFDEQFDWYVKEFTKRGKTIHFFVSKSDRRMNTEIDAYRIVKRDKENAEKYFKSYFGY